MKCARCQNVKTDMQVLPCEHIFCQECLFCSEVRNTANQDELKCLHCNTKVPMDSKNINTHSLPEVHMISKILK